MAYLFLDNRGRANVYDKKELVPGGMKVLLGTKYDSAVVNLNVFFTAVKVNRKASRSIRRALDRTFHIFQYGEDTADIVLQGMAIAESQANNLWKNETSNEQLSKFNEAQTTTQSKVEKKLKELDDKWLSSSQKQWVDADGNPYYEGVVSEGRDPDKSIVTDFFQGIRDWAYNPADEITGKGSKMLPKIYGALNTSIDTIQKYVVSPISNISSEAMKTVKHLLGISEPDNQLDTRQVDMKIGTITELNAFFRAFNSGNNSERITVSICGIPIFGLMDTLTFQSLPKGQGYSFTLGLTGLQFFDGVTKTSYIDPVILHPQGGTLSSILQGGANIGFNAIRTGDSNLTRIF